MGKRNWKKWLAVLLCMAMCMGNAGAVRVYAAVTDGETGEELEETPEQEEPAEEEEEPEEEEKGQGTPGEGKPGTTGEEKPGTSGEEKPEISKDDEGEKPEMSGEGELEKPGEESGETSEEDKLEDLEKEESEEFEVDDSDHTDILSNESMMLLTNSGSGDDYPDKYKNAQPDTIVDEWNFYNRECTSFVAWRLNSRNSISFTNWYRGVKWGNASNWAGAARSLGITVDMNPAVGAVAWWETGTYGHVAWVSSVDGNNVTIEEYNGYGHPYAYNKRTISKTEVGSYIHIADISETPENVHWTLDKNGVLTIYDDEGMPGWTGNVHSEFHGQENAKSIILKENVTSIKGSAFVDFRDVVSITIPSSVTSIGSLAFQGCSNLTNITIPGSVTSIERLTFSYCSSLTSIRLPNRITSIADNAFAYCGNMNSIFIPSGVTLIEYAAFANCNQLADVYYSGSKSEWEAIQIRGGNECLTNATIHFNSSGMGSVDPQKEYKIYWGSGYESFDISLEDCIAKTSSTIYNPQLAHMLIAMCNSVYSEANIRPTFENFGFKSEDMDIDNSQNGIYLTYGMAKKQVGNQTVVLVVVRGTEGIFSIESASNIVDSGLNSEGRHSGFSDAAKGLRERLQTRLGITNLQDAVFVITGFSRGAAAANILSAQLMDEGAQQYNVFTYTFACPDIGTAALNNSYESIFNINDAKDIVSWTPRGWMPGFSNWEKYGRSYWYCENWDDYETLEMGMNAHNQSKYLEYLRQEKSMPEFKTRYGTKTKLDEAKSWRDNKFWNDVKNNFLAFIGIHCPVDIEIYASDGKLVGSVKNNLANSVDTDKVFISVVNDEKNIYLLDDDTYALKLNATGEDTMTYIVQNIDAKTRDIIGEQNYENVALTTGKKFTSEVIVKNNIAVDVEMKKVKLYVIDNNGKPEKEVLADGNGTEIPIKDDDDPGNKPGTDPGNKPGDKPSSKPNGGSSNGGGGGASDSKASASTLYDRNASGKTVVEAWKPQTPDEKKRYACMGTEAVQYTLAKDNAYCIVIENAMQGPLCFASFESALDGYTIGRTYNIYTLPNNVYSREQEVQFTLTIPEAVYKKGRTYKMICVTKNGVPVIYDDLDDNPRTITVRTNKFYAYALIYK